MPGNTRTPLHIKEEASALFKITYEIDRKTQMESTKIVNEMLGTNISLSTFRRWANVTNLGCDKTGKKRGYYKTKYTMDFKKKAIIMRYDELMSTGKSQCYTVTQINKEFDYCLTASNINYWKKIVKSEDDKIIGKRIYYDEMLQMMRIAND